MYVYYALLALQIIVYHCIYYSYMYEHVFNLSAQGLILSYCCIILQKRSSLAKQSQNNNLERFERLFCSKILNFTLLSSCITVLVSVITYIVHVHEYMYMYITTGLTFWLVPNKWSSFQSLAMLRLKSGTA